MLRLGSTVTGESQEEAAVVEEMVSSVVLPPVATPQHLVGITSRA
jgi:hypothetical protein